MPYCQNCGTKNEEGAQVCVNCREPLYDTRRRRARHDGCYGPRGEQHHKEECFGPPDGGAIVGILFGFIILIFGVASVLSLTLGISFNRHLGRAGPRIVCYLRRQSLERRYWPRRLGFGRSEHDHQPERDCYRVLHLHKDKTQT